MIRQERGNALLVGVGGCGKQSLTRLASHMCGYRCFEIELSRGYNYDSFHEDLRRLYKLAGVQGNDMVFLFTDTQVGHHYVALAASGCPTLCLCPCLYTGHDGHVFEWGKVTDGNTFLHLVVT